MAESTKDRIVAAALETLKEDGFAGTSARSIARRGGFNQALIFYHFGTLNDLLLAALDRTSDVRMEKYREGIAEIDDLDSAVRAATALYREDLSSGHITVLSEMIAGSLDRDDLGPEILRRMEPWIELTTLAVKRILRKHKVTGAIDPQAAAYGIVALYLGIDLLSHLEKDDAKAESFFDMAQRVTSVLSRLGTKS